MLVPCGGDLERGGALPRSPRLTRSAGKLLPATLFILSILGFALAWGFGGDEPRRGGHGLHRHGGRRAGRRLDASISACDANHSTCALVTQNCELGTGASQLFDYFQFHYCTLGSIQPLSYILLFLWLLVVFSLLASTADNYFVVLLETLSEELRLSPATAGITLLALGNSAPDVFSDLAAVKNADDFALAIGELMGASMFLTTVVLGAVILFSTKGSDECEVDRIPFLRDVAVFLLACAFILVLSLTEGSLTTTEALAIIGIYLVYVAAVVTSQYVNCSRYCCARNKAPPNGVLADSDCKRNPPCEPLLHVPLDPSGGDSNAPEGMTAVAAAVNHAHPNNLHRMKSMFEDPVTHESTDLSHARRSSVASSGSSGDAEDEAAGGIVGLSWESDASILDKIIVVIEFPFSILRSLSIPPSDKKWDAKRRVLAAIAPMGAVCVIFLDFSQNWCGDACNTVYDGFTQPLSATIATPMIVVPLAIALVAGIVIYFMSRNDALPRFYLVLVLLAFISCIAWLDLIGNECVALLEALGTVMGVTTTQRGHSILGITVLAWANSIGDFVADTAVARAGRPKMGVASTFGSPLLTACLGLGFATVIASASTGSVESHINGEIKMSYIFLGISLISSLIIIPLNKFSIPRWYAGYLFVVYLLYMVMSTLVVCGVIWG